MGSVRIVQQNRLVRWPWCRVVIEVTNPLAREQTMTRTEDKAKVVAIKELLERDEDFVRSTFCDMTVLLSGS
jgi:hypothetical protein